MGQECLFKLFMLQNVQFAIAMYINLHILDELCYVGPSHAREMLEQKKRWIEKNNAIKQIGACRHIL